MGACQLRALLLDGKACVCSGAAEFSRDADQLLLTEPENLKRLRQALAGLRNEQSAVPLCAAGFLERVRAVHCQCPRQKPRVSTNGNATARNGSRSRLNGNNFRPLRRRNNVGHA